MNEHIIWHQSVIKKYSSSNHFKLLNQLRLEVKKYPLNKKKDISSNRNNGTKNKINTNLETSSYKDPNLSNISKNNKDPNNNKSTISFNNSKNFSIYNNQSNQKERNILEQNNSSESKISSSFKDRLDQIDMK